ncbi:TerD family protein [Kitasatospora sp. NPDC018619]|uniref:TerD family protein n=1 Tax=unclassified Kitasatospora TaxID=2633591 RepID=UPI00379FB6C5
MAGAVGGTAGRRSRTAGGDAVELDVTAFLCAAGGRVLSDEHFVFFNNPQEPDGAVRLQPTRSVPGEPTRAARLALDLHRLPPAVAEVVVAVSTEEEEPPALPLGYVHGLSLAAVYGPGASGPDAWAGPTGGVPDSAMLLGAFRRAGGGWEFSPSGRAVTDGLAGLATAFGVAVE